MGDIQNKMFLERRNKDILRQSHQDALAYLDGILDRQVFPTEEALAGLKQFEEVLGDEPTAAVEVLDQLNSFGSPATVATSGGRYFGFVTGSATPVGLAAKTLATYWDQNAGLHVMSPISSKLEDIVENWLVDLFNMPEGTKAGFVSGTSMANLCAVAAARYRLLLRKDWDINKRGLFGAPPIRVVTGRHAHSSVLKAIAILGLGRDNIEWVDVDDQGRMMPDSLPALDSNTLLILQAGNVNSGAFDPFQPVCQLAKKAGAWVHVDGAFGLWAEASAETKYLTKGIQEATSWAVDGHKTLNTPYDCGVVMCADSDALMSALHMSASYIIESNERDGMLFTAEMSRRARAVELWATMKYLGKSGIDEMFTTMVHRAQQFAAEIDQVSGFTVLNDVVFNQVLVRCENDLLTEQVLTVIQELRECWLGGSSWFGEKVMRVSISSWATTEEDITRAVRSFVKAIAIFEKRNLN